MLLSNFYFIYNSWSCHIPLNTLGILPSERIFTSKCLISIHFSVPSFFYYISATETNIYVFVIFIRISSSLKNPWRKLSVFFVLRRLCGLCETGFCDVQSSVAKNKISSFSFFLYSFLSLFLSPFPTPFYLRFSPSPFPSLSLPLLFSCLSSFLPSFVCLSSPTFILFAFRFERSGEGERRYRIARDARWIDRWTTIDSVDHRRVINDVPLSNHSKDFFPLASSSTHVFPRACVFAFSLVLSLYLFPCFSRPFSSSVLQKRRATFSLHHRCG